MKDIFTKDYILNNKEKVIKAAAIFLVIAVALFVFFTKTGNNEEISIEKPVAQTEKNEKKKEIEAVIIADVSGAVASPKVVELQPNSRIEDAINAAGGLDDNADLSNINRAAVVNDGDKIYIPKKGESSATSDQKGSKNQDNNVDSGKININTATTTELQTLTGVGPATAEKILLFRSTNGDFKKIEDLKKVNGIGEKTYEKMKDNITI